MEASAFLVRSEGVCYCAIVNGSRWMHDILWFLVEVHMYVLYIYNA